MKDIRKKLIKILNNKVIEGTMVLDDLSITDDKYSSLVVSVLNTNIEVKNLQQQLEYDKKIKDNKEKEIN